MTSINRQRWLALVPIAMGVSGCTSPLAAPAWLDGEMADRADAARLRAGEETGLAAAGGLRDIQPPDPTLGARGYVEAAVRSNPRLRAARLRVRRLLARVPQVMSLDDPMLQVSPVGEMAETAAGEVQLMAGVSQKFPWPGKLEARGRIALQEAAMARADLDAARLEVTAQTLRAYWSLYAAARAIEVTRESRDLLVQLRDVAEANYRAGTAQQADVLRASVELGELDRELVTLGQTRGSAEAMLNRLLDRPVTAPLPDPPAASVQDIGERLDALLATAARSNPTLHRLREQLEGDRQRLRLARLNRLPDLTVGLQYNAVDDDGLAIRANGDDQWWLTLGVNLPIWNDKYDAARREATLGGLESLALLHAEGDRVEFEVRDAYERVRAGLGNVTLLRQRIVPEAERAVDATLSQYRGGGGDFLAVMEAWRRVLRLRQMLYGQEAMAEQAAADLRRAVGDAAEPQPMRADDLHPGDELQQNQEVQP